MYIITGGAGFIGSAFVAKLNSEGIRDIIVVDNLGTSDKWKNLLGKEIKDYVHKEKFRALLEADEISYKVDAIVHLGACSSTTEPDLNYLMENNYKYSKLCAQWAIANNVRFIYASSAATYGDGSNGYSDDVDSLLSLKPLNPYGFSKYLFDSWVASSGILNKVAGLKFFNVYGPNEYHKGDMTSVICKSFHQINQSGKVKLFKSYRKEFKDGEQLRDFIYIKDCCEVMWWLLRNRKVSGIFNLGTGKARTWNDLVMAVFKALDKRPQIEYIDMPSELRDRYQYFTEARMDKLKKAGYSFKFTSLEDGVADYVKNYLSKNSWM